MVDLIVAQLWAKGCHARHNMIALTVAQLWAKGWAEVEAWGGPELRLFPVLHMNIFCMYSSASGKETDLKISTVFAYGKDDCHFQPWKESQVFLFLLPILTLLLSFPLLLQISSRALIKQKESWLMKVIQTVYHKLTISSISIDWRDLHYELGQCKKTMVNSTKNKEIDHLNKRKGSNINMYPLLLSWNLPWRS